DLRVLAARGRLRPWRNGDRVRDRDRDGGPRDAHRRLRPLRRPSDQRAHDARLDRTDRRLSRSSPGGLNMTSRPGPTTNRTLAHRLAPFEGSMPRCAARSEAMDGELYVAEYMMRDRIAEMRASADVARLLRQSTERSQRDSVGSRLLETGRSLVKTARKMAFAISHGVGNGTHVAKHP